MINRLSNSKIRLYTGARVKNNFAGKNLDKSQYSRDAKENVCINKFTLTHMN